MNSYRTALILLCTLTSPVALADAPLGTNEFLRPTVGRYAISLTVDAKAPGQGKCPRFSQSELVLVDISGKIVQSPFVVPTRSSFILTDVTWTAHPWPNGNQPGAPFDPAQEVMLVIDRQAGPVAWSTMVHADHVQAGYAAGQHAFTTGVAYGAGQILCVDVLLPDPFGGWVGKIYDINVHGYVDDFTKG